MKVAYTKLDFSVLPPCKKSPKYVEVFTLKIYSKVKMNRSKKFFLKIIAGRSSLLDIGRPKPTYTGSP